MTRLIRRLWPVLLIGTALALLFATGANRYLSLDALRENEQALRAFVSANLIVALALFVAVYAASVTLYVPGASILTLAGGFLFGTWLGAGATVVGATLGALGGWQLVRTAVGEPLRRRAEHTGGTLNRLIAGLRGDAFSYVLSLRLIPVAPFWLVNAAAGVAAVRLAPYALATLFGIIPATVIYSSVGAGLGALFRRGERPDLGIIFEPQILWPLIGLALLSFIPSVVRRLRGANAAA